MTFVSAEPPLPRAGSRSVQMLGGRRLEFQVAAGMLLQRPCPGGLVGFLLRVSNCLPGLCQRRWGPEAPGAEGTP